MDSSIDVSAEECPLALQIGSARGEVIVPPLESINAVPREFCCECVLLAYQRLYLAELKRSNALWKLKNHPSLTLHRHWKTAHCSQLCQKSFVLYF